MRIREKSKQYSLVMKIAYVFTLAIHAISVIILALRLVLVHSGSETQAEEANLRLMLTQCLLATIVMHAPYVMEIVLKRKIPTTLCISYWVFITCSVFLGEVCSFYYRIKNWDDILHFFSAFLTGLLAYMIFSHFMRDSSSGKATFMLIFAVCFSVTVGALWEIYEFTFDGLMGLNMQKFAHEDGTELIGRLALEDTMKDVIVDVLGALLCVVYGYVSIKRKRGFAYSCIAPEYTESSQISTQCTSAQ